MSVVLDYKIVMKDGTVHEQKNKYSFIRDAVYETIEQLYPGTHLPYACKFTLTDPKEILRFGQTLGENSGESDEFEVKYIDDEDDYRTKTFNIYTINLFIELVQAGTRILEIDTHVWNDHLLTFPQTHYHIFELSVDTPIFGEPKETEVSQKDLQIFINYCMRVAENKKLCFGFHVDKIESVTIHMW